MATKGTSKDIGDVKASTPEISMFSDAVMTVLTNKNNPVVECRFEMFSLQFNWFRLFTESNRCRLSYSVVNFKYKIYEIHTL